MRTKRLINKIVRCAKDKGWNVNIERHNGMTIFEFSQFTPAGQDFSFTAEMQGNHLDSLIMYMNDYYEGFDVDSEAYVWLDESGHGRNGAPYRMRDVLKDMEAAEKRQCVFPEKKKAYISGLTAVTPVTPLSPLARLKRLCANPL